MDYNMKHMNLEQERKAKRILFIILGLIVLLASLTTALTPPFLNNPLITQAPQNDPANLFFQFGKIGQNLGEGFNQFAYAIAPGMFVSYQQYVAQNQAYILENQREAYLLTAEAINKTVSTNQFNATIAQIGSGSNVTLQVFNATVLTTQSTINNATQRQMAQSFINTSVNAVNNEDAILNVSLKPIGLTAKAGKVSPPTAKVSARVAKAVVNAPKALSQSVAQSAVVATSAQAGTGQSGSLINSVFGQGGFFGLH